jgi:hypothetical protein
LSIAGENVPVADLRFVPFAQGPMHLADLEVDPRKMGMLAVVLLLLAACAWWVVAGS